MTPALPVSRALSRLASGFLLGLVAGCGGGGGGGGGGIELTPNSVDLTVDAGELERTISFSTEFFDVDDCAVVEGLVEAPGARRLMRFSTVVMNFGTLDVIVGDPESPAAPLTPADFELSPCHGHYHFHDWADYELRDGLDQVAAVGHKQAFCLLDSLRYVGFGPGNGYDCDYQGITSGFGDWYPAGLDGQWIDITDVPPGSYEIVVRVNTAGKIVEADDRHPNTVRVPVVIPEP
jgi:hypothetical protein